MLDSSNQPLYGYAQDITVYESPQFYYVLGRVEILSYQSSYVHDGSRWKILKIEKGCGASLKVAEDQLLYTKQELDSTIALLHTLNKGSLKCIQGPCPALLGIFASSSGCHYLLLATKVRSKGCIQGCEIYGVDGTTLLPLESNGYDTLQQDREDRKLLSLLNLTSDFYFSFSFDTWSTVQSSALGQACGARDVDGPFDCDRVWNAHFTKSLRDALGNDACIWAVPLVQGSWQQETVVLCGQRFNVTLIGRRSRKFAGTRYLKRGISTDGFVANDVEVEQVVEVAGRGDIASFVQRRGSVPVFWNQMPSLKGFRRAGIRLLNFLDPFARATHIHFHMLKAKYGDPIICLNLCQTGSSDSGNVVNKEHVLSEAYEEVVQTINHGERAGGKIELQNYDLREELKQKGSNMLKSLQAVQNPMLKKTGIFVASKYVNTIQHGIVRTNCVDCVDRTNVAQFSLGLLALGEQLHALGIAPADKLEIRSSLSGVLMGMYEKMGNKLGQQYVSSSMQQGFFGKWRGHWSATRQSKYFITSLRRFYSSTVTDEEKQRAIDYFLGQPGLGKSPSSLMDVQEEESAFPPSSPSSSIDTATEMLEEDNDIGIDMAGELEHAFEPISSIESLQRSSADPPSETREGWRSLFTKADRIHNTKKKSSEHLESLSDVMKGVKNVKITATISEPAPSTFMWLASPRRTTSKSSMGSDAGTQSSPKKRDLRIKTIADGGRRRESVDSLWNTYMTPGSSPASHINFESTKTKNASLWSNDTQRAFQDHMNTSIGNDVTPKVIQLETSLPMHHANSWHDDSNFGQLLLNPGFETNQLFGPETKFCV
jgi:hypothetical protein